MNAEPKPQSNNAAFAAKLKQRVPELFRNRPAYMNRPPLAKPEPQAYQYPTEQPEDVDTQLPETHPNRSKLRPSATEGYGSPDDMDDNLKVARAGEGSGKAAQYAPDELPDEPSERLPDAVDADPEEDTPNLEGETVRGPRKIPARSAQPSTQPRPSQVSVTSGPKAPAPVTRPPASPANPAQAQIIQRAVPPARLASADGPSVNRPIVSTGPRKPDPAPKSQPEDDPQEACSQLLRQMQALEKTYLAMFNKFSRLDQRLERIGMQHSRRVLAIAADNCGPDGLPPKP